MARQLRAALADRGVTLGHGEALELVARQLVRATGTPSPPSSLHVARPSAIASDGHVVPILRVFDEAAALAFYVDYLDFRVDWRNETGGHEPLYAQLSRGDARIHLSGHHGDASPGSGVLVPVPDALDLQLSLKAKEYAYANPGVEDRPWGRVVTVIDPFSNRIVFLESNRPRVCDSHPSPNRDLRRRPRRSSCTSGPPAPRSRPSRSSPSASASGGPGDAYSPGPLRGIRVEPRVGGEVAMLLEAGDDLPAR
jgi:catechol 2,3-dioxygenase-like lactoylglutathione lyase family enzyme